MFYLNVQTLLKTYFQTCIFQIPSFLTISLLADSLSEDSESSSEDSESSSEDSESSSGSDASEERHQKNVKNPPGESEAFWKENTIRIHLVTFNHKEFKKKWKYHTKKEVVGAILMNLFICLG